VIATPVGGIPDFLEHKETGLFCQVKDAESIAEKVKFLISNPDLKDKLVQQAYQMVVEKYNWKMITQDMKKLFNSYTK